MAGTPGSPPPPGRPGDPFPAGLPFPKLPKLPETVRDGEIRAINSVELLQYATAVPGQKQRIRWGSGTKPWHSALGAGSISSTVHVPHEGEINRGGGKQHTASFTQFSRQDCTKLGWRSPKACPRAGGGSRSRQGSSQDTNILWSTSRAPRGGRMKADSCPAPPRIHATPGQTKGLSQNYGMAWAGRNLKITRFKTPAGWDSRRKQLLLSH